MPTIYIDIGSSTVKVYKADQELEHLFNRSIAFKEGFSEQEGLSKDSKEELISLLNKVKQEYPNYQIKLYATALYRKLHDQIRTTLIDEVFEQTGLYFNIISHNLENYYLQKALIGKYQGTEPTLLVNIGGGSTELVVVKDEKPIETLNIPLGIGQVLTEFQDINSEVSDHSLAEVADWIQSQLPALKTKTEIALYSGGELNYMQLARYNLTDNDVFKDPKHPSQISSADFKSRNSDVFCKVTLAELEQLMPDDPKWMHGARACSAIAQAIFNKYGIQKIIPSNANLIDGVFRQEFRKVTISGSFRKHLEQILAVKKMLNDKGITVLSPRFTEPKNPGEEFVIFEGEDGQSPLELERRHMKAIDESDALIICNPDGYVGASATLEIGYAHKHQVRTIYIEEPEEFMLQTLPHEVGL